MATVSFGQTDIFINEIHYENVGLDLDEGIEIAGPSGTDLTGWKLIFYRGSVGTFYATETLLGIIPNQQNSRGTIWFPKKPIQNGPDGIALIDPLGNLIQFLSYEGIITAAGGTANGIISTDIGVAESDATTANTESLQLMGSGANYEDFTWATAATSTHNLKNNGQTFSPFPAIINNNYKVTNLDYEVNSGPSIEGTIVIEGTNLTADITIDAPSNFEISETSGSGWVSSINLSPSSGTVAITTIYVRLKSGLTIGNYNQNLTCTSADAVTKASLLSGIVSPSAGSIIITEIMQFPNTVSDTNGEYFEVYNTTASAIDMQGWVISDLGLDSHIIGSGLIVPANEYAVLARDANIGDNGGFNADYDYSGFILANTADEIILTSGATEIDRVDYNAATFPFGAGTSMELHLYKYNNVSNDSASNWGAATTAYGNGDLGTPGAANSFGLSILKNQIPNFAMYPNPVSNGMLYMSSNNNINKQVEIYTVTGQQVYSKNLQTKEHINISKLTKGIYLVKVEEEGKIATRKLVVN